MTNAEARFSKSLRPRKPEGSLGRTAQDVHLDSHTAPELCLPLFKEEVFEYSPLLFCFVFLFCLLLRKRPFARTGRLFVSGFYLLLIETLGIYGLTRYDLTRGIISRVLVLCSRLFRGSTQFTINLHF